MIGQMKSPTKANMLQLDRSAMTTIVVIEESMLSIL